MACRRRKPLRLWLSATSLALLAATGTWAGETAFTSPVRDFTGSVTAGAATRGAAVVPGGMAVIRGEHMVPGQQITLMRGRAVLNADGPLIVDAEGKFRFPLTVDAGAHTGLQPIVMVAENPAAAQVVPLKISPDLALQGAEGFEITDIRVGPGLYQVAFGAAAEAVFVTSAVGRPPVQDSALYRIHAESLEIAGRSRPDTAPRAENGRDGGVFALYGLGIDEANGTIWATNTRQNTVAVYRQSDLSLVRQFEPGSVSHSRDVVIDAERGRAYVSTALTPVIEVFDTGALHKTATIALKSLQPGGAFGAMSLALDAKAGRLFTVSMQSDEYAVVDLTDLSSKTFALPGADGPSGLAYDPVEDLLFVASQNSDNLLIVKASDGRILQNVPVGAGALNVTFEPVSRLAFVACRGAGTIAVVEPGGQLRAVLDAGSLPNHLQADGRGAVWAVNKSRGEDDASGDRLWRLVPKAE